MNRAPHNCNNCDEKHTYYPLKALLVNTDWDMVETEYLDVDTGAFQWLLCPECVKEFNFPPWEERKESYGVDFE